MADRRSPLTGAELPIGRPFQQGSEQREIARRGGKASAAKRAQRKTLRDELLYLLSEAKEGDDGKMHTVNERVCVALIKQAMQGNVRAVETIRDTIGEKPVDNIAITAPDFSALDAIDWNNDK